MWSRARFANAQLVRRPAASVATPWRQYRSADPVAQAAAAGPPVQRQPDDADQCLALALMAGDREMVGRAVGDPPNRCADPLVRQFARIGIGKLRQGARYLPIIDQAMECLRVVRLQRPQRQPLGRQGCEVASLTGCVLARLARGAWRLALRLRQLGGGNRFDPVRLPVGQVGADCSDDARAGETGWRARVTRHRPTPASSSPAPHRNRQVAKSEVDLAPLCRNWDTLPIAR